MTRTAETGRRLENRRPPAVRRTVRHLPDERAIACEALRRQRIEYNIVSVFVLQTRQVKERYRALALNPFDDIALSKLSATPPRGFDNCWC